MLLHRFLVVGVSLSFLEGDGSPGAFADAVAETVAVGLADKLRLSADDLYGSLVAGVGTDAAAVALVLVDGDDFPQYLGHRVSPLCKSARVVFFRYSTNSSVIFSRREPKMQLPKGHLSLWSRQ
ncbi:hypothetical protein SDC9_202556 [bioreactor metagenome]|uniref:Uncharacterized protein n=1 Tax=bioreactor metagenome TaxID=1076179 RepID=A0A645ITY6_9ZZZZ